MIIIDSNCTNVPLNAGQTWTGITQGCDTSSANNAEVVVSFDILLVKN